MKEAMLYERIDEAKVRCALCAHRCLIGDGKRGICGLRENRDGTLYSLAFGKLIATNIDPVEKKPLFHFQPGSHTYSVASVGCNFRCAHCQNYDISQYPHAHPDSPIPGRETAPDEVVQAALQSGCRSISYTYTEPTVWLEFCLDTARRAREHGLKNIFVSNGYMTPESARTIGPLLDGNNIDLKGDEKFYEHICKAHLGPVKDTITLMKELGVWVEVTTLVIPGHNDSDRSLTDIAEFIRSVDPAMPWHVTRFSPTYKMTDRPPTPAGTLRRAVEIGQARGLKYIYEGNIPGQGGEDTVCPNCGETIINRIGFNVISNRIKTGACPACSTPQPGVWQ